MDRQLRIRTGNRAKIQFAHSGGDQEGFELRHINKYIGAGVFSTKKFNKGDFLLEYRGEYIGYQEAITREKNYKPCKGSFLFFFKSGRYGKKCIDATNSTGLGRMVNDEVEKLANAKIIVIPGDPPRLGIFAKRDLDTGMEIRYDYGVTGLPWRKKSPSSVLHSLPAQSSQSIVNDYLSSLTFCGLKKDVETARNLDKPHEPTSASNVRGTCESLDPPHSLLSEKSKNESSTATQDQPSTSTAGPCYNGGNRSLSDDGVYDSKTNANNNNKSNPAEKEVSSLHGILAACSLLPKKKGKVNHAPRQNQPSTLTALKDKNVIVSDDASNNESEEDSNDDYVPETDEDDFSDDSDKSEQFEVIGDRLKSSRYSQLEKNRQEESSARSAPPQQDQPSTSPTAGHYSNTCRCNSSLSVAHDSKTDADKKETNPAEQEARKKKPRRPCPYCGIMQARLNRHMQSKHKKEEAIKQAQKLPQREKERVFRRLRLQGIYDHNKELMKTGDSSRFLTQRAQKPDAKLVICSSCNGFYNRHFFWSHKKNCNRDSVQHATPLPTPLLKAHPKFVTIEFKESILSGFQEDDIGNLCREDHNICMFGARMFDKMKRKQDKKSEVRKSVMTDMRRVATLYHEFRLLKPNHNSESSAEMFDRQNFDTLQEAINQVTQKDPSSQPSNHSTLKAGLKISIFYLLKKMSKVLKGSYLVSGNDQKAQDIDKFIDILTLNKDFIFGDAVYSLQRNRHINLRKPERLPLEDDVKVIRDYTVTEISKMLLDNFLYWSSQEFVKLRDLTASRITLFNARRGGEPARLTISEWEEAANDSWLNTDYMKHINEQEKVMFKQMKVTFQTGKGNNHLVPVLIPTDCTEAMAKLANSEIRKVANVHPSNLYMFPCIQGSLNHMSGWHSVQRVCAEAKVHEPAKMTATAYRHRASTLYAGMDVPDQERQLFYKHMGHSALVNANVYQAPLAIQEVQIVGKRLQQMDLGMFGPSEKTRNETTTMQVNASPCSTTRSTTSATSVPTDHSEDHTTAGKQTGQRSYTKWSAVATKAVVDHFKAYIDGTNLPLQPPEEAVNHTTTMQVNTSCSTTSKSTTSVQPPEEAVNQTTTTAENTNSASTPRATENHQHQSSTAAKKDTGQRNYTKWSNVASNAVVEHFNAFVDGTSLPRKADILPFLRENSFITCSWETVRTKVLNEQKARATRLKKKMSVLHE